MLTWKWDHEIFTIIIKDIEKALESKSYTDSWLFVSEKYHDLINVFERQNINKLFSHQKKYDIRIDLKSGKTSSFESLYDMLWNELQMLQQYLNKHLAKNFIQSSYFLFMFSVLFAKKSNRELWFCINYQVLNIIII